MPLPNVAVFLADVDANASVIPAGQPFAGLEVRNVPKNGDGAAQVAWWYSQAATPAYHVIRTNASVKAIRNAILWPRYTPAPAITGANAAQANAASNYCMAKVSVLQVLLGLGADGEFDATQATQTSGLRDATTAIPSAGAFANQDAGWGVGAGIGAALIRPARRVEKLFAVANATVTALNDGTSARGAAGNPDLMAYEGDLSDGDVRAAWGI